MHFDRFGLTFDYPDNWSLDTEDAEGRFATASVQSPGGAFWTVSGHAPGGDPAELVKAFVTQMKEEYQELDAEAAESEVAGRRLPGCDLNFYCLDLTNTAEVRTLTTPTAIYLIIAQAEDREWEEVAPVFTAITTSFVRGLGG